MRPFPIYVDVPADDPLAEFPAELPGSAAHPDRVYRRVPEHFAVHGAVPDALGPIVTLALEEGVTVCRGGADAAPPSRHDVVVTPVYALHVGGRIAVPTGRVFVRFAEDVAAADRRAELRRAGYVVSSIPAYAPHAAWVESAEGGPAAGLHGLARLAALRDVVEVEPEMLGKRARR